VSCDASDDVCSAFDFGPILSLSLIPYHRIPYAHPRYHRLTDLLLSTVTTFHRDGTGVANKTE
jgi:hypothetical protein